MEIAEARWALRSYSEGKKLEPGAIRDLYLAGYLGIRLEPSEKELHPTVITEKGKQLLEA
jgi:hypothetical protein